MRRPRIARKSDGRRIFTSAFKREQVGRVMRGELTLAELSRKEHIARGLLQRWKRQLAPRAPPQAGARALLVPVTALQAAEDHIRELERLVGRQTVELEALRSALDGARGGRGAERARG